MVALFSEWRFFVRGVKGEVAILTEISIEGTRSSLKLRHCEADTFHAAKNQIERRGSCTVRKHTV